MNALMPATATATATATPPAVAANTADKGRRGGARDRLLAAALRRFGEDGAGAVNLEDVRQEAGVSVGALYHHFADKAALVDALYAEVTARFQLGFLEMLQASPSAEDGIRRGVRYFVRWVQEHRHETAIL